MSEWQPIASAPKDGTTVLVFNGPNVGFYTPEGSMGTAVWREQAFPDAIESWCAADCCDGVTTYDPTHWMPLPEPPEGA